MGGGGREAAGSEGLRGSEGQGRDAFGSEAEGEWRGLKKMIMEVCGYIYVEILRLRGERALRLRGGGEGGEEKRGEDKNKSGAKKEAGGAGHG